MGGRLMPPTDPKPDPEALREAKRIQAEREERRLARGRAMMAERDRNRAARSTTLRTIGYTGYSKRQLARMDESES